MSQYNKICSYKENNEDIKKLIHPSPRRSEITK